MTDSNQARTVFITGASGETGRALIAQIADSCDTVFAHFHKNDEKLLALRDELRGRSQNGNGGPEIIPVQADFSDAESVRRMTEQILATGKPLDALVLLAAPQVAWNKFAKFTWADYQNEIDSSLRPAVMIAQAFVPQMAKQKRGRVVFLLTAHVCAPDPKYMSPYIVAKHALYGLMKNLSAEYAEKGVTVNGVSPEMMDTPFVENVPALAKKLAAEQGPDGRLVSPAAPAAAVAYLLSDDAAGITGENIYVNSAGAWEKPVRKQASSGAPGVD